MSMLFVIPYPFVEENLRARRLSLENKFHTQYVHNPADESDSKMLNKINEGKVSRKKLIGDIEE